MYICLYFILILLLYKNLIYRFFVRWFDIFGHSHMWWHLGYMTAYYFFFTDIIAEKTGMEHLFFDHHIVDVASEPTRAVRDATFEYLMYGNMLLFEIRDVTFEYMALGVTQLSPLFSAIAPGWTYVVELVLPILQWVLEILSKI